MKYAIAVVASVLLLTLPARADCGHFNVVQRVRVKEVVQVQRVKVKEVVQVKEVRNEIRFAQVVTPLVQVTEVAYPVYAAPVYAAPVQDNSRLDRLERAVERMAVSQEALIQAIKVK